MSASLAVEALAQLQADVERLTSEREHYRELYLRTLERCCKLELGLLGQKSERLSGNDAQLTMAVLATLLGERPDAVEPDGRRVQLEAQLHGLEGSCRLGSATFTRTFDPRW